MMQQDAPVAGQGEGSVMDCLLLLMSSIGFSIFGYFCRLGYCVVHVFPLTLLLLYKVEQVRTCLLQKLWVPVFVYHL